MNLRPLGYEYESNLEATRQNATTRENSRLFCRLFAAPDGRGRWEIQRLSSDQEFPQSVAMRVTSDTEARASSPESLRK